MKIEMGVSKTPPTTLNSNGKRSIPLASVNQNMCFTSYCETLLETAGQIKWRLCSGNTWWLVFGTSGIRTRITFTCLPQLLWQKVVRANCIILEQSTHQTRVKTKNWMASNVQNSMMARSGRGSGSGNYSPKSSGHMVSKVSTVKLAT